MSSYSYKAEKSTATVWLIIFCSVIEYTPKAISIRFLQHCIAPADSWSLVEQYGILLSISTPKLYTSDFSNIIYVQYNVGQIWRIQLWRWYAWEYIPVLFKQGSKNQQGLCVVNCKKLKAVFITLLFSLFLCSCSRIRENVFGHTKDVRNWLFLISYTTSNSTYLYKRKQHSNLCILHSLPILLVLDF